MVKLLLIDCKFECIKDKFDKAMANTTAAREHVGKVKRGIQSVKERCRWIMSDLSVTGIKRIHKWIAVHCVYYCIKMVNSFLA